MKTYLRLLSYAKPYKLLVVGAILASLIYVALNSISIWMVGSLVSQIVSPEAAMTVIEEAGDALSLNDKLKSLTSSIVGQGDQTQQLFRLCVMLLIIFLLKNVFFYINKLGLGFVQNRMITDIRQRVYEHIHRLSLSFFDKNKSAEIHSILIRDVNVMRTAFTQSVQKLIVEPANLIAFLFLLMVISVKLTLIALITIPISAIFIVKLGQSIRRKAKRSSKQIAGVMNVMQESLQGMRIVKAFGTEEYEVDRFKKENNRFFRLIFRQARLNSLNSPVNEIIGVLIGVSLLWFGGSEVIAGNGIAADDFMRFVLLLFAMLQPVRTLGTVNAHIQAGVASAERVFSIVDTEPEIRESDDPKILGVFQNDIVFKDVSFHYNIDEIPSLKNIDVTIRKGQVVALVGMSGAGKTTFVDLIPRFYDVTSGGILLDGIDIRDYSVKSLRHQMGIVTQETILFNDTLFNNIAYGKPESTLDAVIAAAKAANADDFIQLLPDKYDTVIGERGTRLSGGERQRISIARAILRNPAILILDEATSALDTEAEKKVQQAIDHAMENRTVIVIAHRLSTIFNADKILVLDKGKLLESGTHKELLKLGGKYRLLYDTQFQGQHE